jgi:ABC-type proline/glycine betaine transport system ATPase subunit
MDSTFSVGAAAARLLLLPGEIACGAMGLARDDKSELVRMLVNSLVWIVVGMLAVVLLA